MKTVMTLPVGFSGMSELIENPEADLTNFPDRVVRINGFPAYCWATSKPMRFFSIAPHAVGPQWYQADNELTLHLERNREPVAHTEGVKHWNQVEEAKFNGHTVSALGYKIFSKKVNGETVTIELNPFEFTTCSLDDLSDEEYDRLTGELQALTDMIRQSRTLDEDFKADTLASVDWELLAKEHAAAVAANDLLAFRTTESYVVAMKGAVSRKNMYRETGNDLAWETDPAVAWHKEMQDLAHGEHMATKAHSEEMAAAAFRAAGWGGEETGHEAARSTSALANPNSAPSYEGRAPDTVEAAIKRNAMPVYKTNAAGQMVVLPSSEQAKPAAERVWWTLPQEKRAAYEAKAREYVKALMPEGKRRALRPDELKPHELAYTPVSSKLVRALRFATWMLEDLGDAYDPDATYIENKAKIAAETELMLRHERMESKGRFTRYDPWERNFGPVWEEGLVEAELPPITPRHTVGELTPFEVGLNEGYMAVLASYGWEQDEMLELTVPELERTARYLQFRQPA